MKKTNQLKTASPSRTVAQPRACAGCGDAAAHRAPLTNSLDVSPRQLAQQDQIQRMVNPVQRVPVNDDPVLEREADVMGDKAMQIGRQSQPQATHQLAASDAGGAGGLAHAERSDGLPASLSAGIRSLSGMDVSHVKLHRNSSKPAQLKAHAYAQGSEIHVAPGQDKHIPHEAWHVVQQMQARVKPTTVALHSESEGDPVQRVINVNGQPVSRALIAGHREEFIRWCTEPLEKAGHGGLTDEDWDRIFRRMDEVAADPRLFRFPVTSALMSAILRGLSNDQIFAEQAPLQAPGGDEEGREEAQEQATTSTRPVVPRLNLGGFQGPVESTSFLNELEPATKTGGWNGGHDRLKDAHHKIGKNVLAWLYERMTSTQQMKVKKALHLDWGSQALALTRLGSNLIAPHFGTDERAATSDSRTDDPMNNSRQSAVGREYLDLMTDNSGSLTPRSRVYGHLADDVVRRIQKRQENLGVEDKDFVLTDGEVDDIIQHLREAELLHFKLEGRVDVPSHSRGDAFTKDVSGETPKYTKARVAPLSDVVSESEEQDYDRAASTLLKQNLTRKKEAIAAKKNASVDQLPSFEQWLELADDISGDVDADEDRYEEWAIEYRLGMLRGVMQASWPLVRMANRPFPKIMLQFLVEQDAIYATHSSLMKKTVSIGASEALYRECLAALMEIRSKYA